MHKLLARQLNRAFGGNVPIIPGLDSFVAAIDEAYEAWDSYREILERSLDITSRIMIEKNEALRTAKETAEKAHERVRSMAMVHEMLYESSDFSSLTLLDYVERISRSIVLPDRESRELSLRLNKVHIGIAQTVPCGLSSPRRY